MINNKKNILQLISSKGFYGAESVVFQLSKELLAKGICCTVGTISSANPASTMLSDICESAEIPTVRFRCNGKIDYHSVIEIRKYVQENDIGIIHSHGYKSNILSYIARKKLNTKCIATCHNWIDNSLRMKLYSILDRQFLKRFDKVVAVSQAVRQKLIDSGILENKVTQIENGIDIKSNCGKSENVRSGNEYGIHPESIVIGTVGRISHEKGHSVLLKCAKNIIGRHPNTIFVIVGDGPEKPVLEQLYADQNIIFTGYQKKTHQFYNLMDIFVLPSLTEGLPMVVLEAMTFGLPVIATNVGEIKKVVLDHETGLVVQPHDIVSLTNAMERLICDRGIAIEMGHRGLERVKRMYSADKMAERYINAYSELV